MLPESTKFKDHLKSGVKLRAIEVLIEYGLSRVDRSTHSEYCGGRENWWHTMPQYYSKHRPELSSVLE